jgi:hypothetical protein
MCEKAIIVRTVSGACWLQTVDAEQRGRLCYLGNVAPGYFVESWCAFRGIAFSDVGGEPLDRDEGKARSVGRAVVA